MKVIWQKSFHWQINGEMKTRLICVSPWGTVVFIRAEHRAARRRKSLTIPMSHGYRCNYLDALMHLHGQSAKEECALSLNSLSRWHLKFSVWIWISDCALHLQTVGFGARETLRWLRCQSLPVFEPRGPMWGRRSGGGAAWIKTPPPANSLIQDFVFGASSPAAHLFLLSQRRQNVSHPQIKLMLVWTCNPLRRYVVRPQRPLKSSVFLFWV